MKKKISKLKFYNELDKAFRKKLHWPALWKNC